MRSRYTWFTHTHTNHRLRNLYQFPRNVDLWPTFDRFPFTLLPSPMEWPYICYCSRRWWWYRTIIIIRAVILNKFPNAPRLYGGCSTLGFSFIHPNFPYRLCAECNMMSHDLHDANGATRRTQSASWWNWKMWLILCKKNIRSTKLRHTFCGKEARAAHTSMRRCQYGFDEFSPPHCVSNFLRHIFCVPLAFPLRAHEWKIRQHRASHIAQVHIPHTRSIHKQIISASAHCFPLWAFLSFPVWNSRWL